MRDVDEPMPEGYWRQYTQPPSVHSALFAFEFTSSSKLGNRWRPSVSTTPIYVAPACVLRVHPIDSAWATFLTDANGRAPRSAVASLAKGLDV